MRPRAAAVSVGLIVLAAGFVLYTSLRARPLPVGSPLPALAYRGVDGAARLTTAGLPTVLMLFSTECSHCRYELDLLQRERASLGGARFVFLTTQSLPLSSVRARWAGLSSLPNVTWGSVGRTAFEGAFGKHATPAFFLFGPDGALRSKFDGEARLAFILARLRGEVAPRGAARQTGGACASDSGAVRRCAAAPLTIRGTAR